MIKSGREQITQLLETTASEPIDSQRVGLMVPLVYEELRAVAKRYFRNERRGHTLQPTALVHEAYLRLVDEDRINWQGRAHFRAICARVMRQVLIDHARSRGRVRRGGGQRVLALQSSVAPLDLDHVDALELHDALEKLEQLDERQAHVVELRFFGGLDVAEVAAVLGVSKRTVEGDWSHAKAWLKSELASQ